MKLLFVSTHNPDSLGVNKKVHNQLDFFNKSGLDVEAIFLHPNQKETTVKGKITYSRFDNYPKLNPIYKRRGLRNYSENLYSKKYYKNLFAQLTELCKERRFDAIYFRYPFASHGLKKFVDEFPQKVVFEHNTLDVEELRRESEYDAGLQYNLHCEQKMAPSIHKNTLMGVAVTGEIKDSLNQRIRKDYCRFLYKNPINVDSFKPRTFRNQDKPKITFLIGNYHNWHGLDLFCDALRNVGKVNQFAYCYIGKASDDVKAIFEGFDVEYLGFKSGQEIVEVFSNSTITLGSLAPFRYNVGTFSSLKTREYFAMGIPFVMGTTDTAINHENKSIKDCYRVLDFRNSVKAIEELEDFISKVQQDPNHPKAMHQYSKEHLDYRPVILELSNTIKNSLDAV